MHSTGQSLPCNNLDLELGDLTGWQGYYGTNIDGVLDVSTAGMIPGRHDIMSAIDSFDVYAGSLIPVVAVGGLYSVKLGNNYGGSEADRLQYSFNVSKSSTNLTYRYAVIMQDPMHSAEFQPHFEIELFDQAGDTIPCGQYSVVAGSGTNSWYALGTVRYKPWETVNMNLSDYIGQTLTLQFTTVDCGKNGHFCYAFIDGLCSEFKISSSDLPCANNVPINLIAPEGSQSYYWSNGESGQLISVSTTDTFSVNMISHTGCLDSLTYILELEDPKSDFLFDQICYGDTTTFQNFSSISIGSIVSEKWNFGDILSGTSDSSSMQNPKHLYTSAGVYVATLSTTSTKNCVDVASKEVEVYGIPVIGFNIDKIKGCVPVSIDFTNLSSLSWGSFGSFLWDFGNGETSVGFSSAYEYTEPGSYVISLSAQSAQGCTNQLQSADTVKIYPSPTADFILDPLKSSMLDPDIQFVNLSTGEDSVHWNFGDFTTSNESNQVHQYTQSGEYLVTLYAITNMGCSDSKSEVITIDPSYVLYVPQAFSPNGDGLNDKFYCAGLGVESILLQVFDRWGGLIHKSEGVPAIWDGTTSVKEIAPTGVYLCLMNVEDEFGEKHIYESTIALIR